MGVLFLMWAAIVFGGTGIHAPDSGLAGWLQSQKNPGVYEAMTWISRMHETLAIAGYVGVLAITGYLTGYRRWSNVFLATVPGGMIFNALVKLVFQRPRPSFLATHTISGSFSFPSGHTTAATLLYGFILWFVFANTHDAWKRVLASIAFVCMVLLVAFSRMYLNVHYFSDVVASMLLGPAVLFLAAHLSMQYLNVRD